MDAYNPPTIFRNRHLATILPNRLRKTRLSNSLRETVVLQDGDFIDLDFFRIGGKKCALLLHGLEGSAQSTYMRGMVSALHQIGIDVCAMNHRGCSGRPNLLLSAYHSGATSDVREMLNYLGKQYEHTVLVGFSLGGNMALKLAGESDVPISLKAVAAISVPIDLHESAKQLSKPSNSIYLHRFLQQLKRKALLKARAFPNGGLDIKAILESSDFESFDEAFTAPVHGFKSAKDYYNQSSCKGFLKNIALPTLLINALNDPFLNESCYPAPDMNHHFLHALTPSLGGHVGFAQDILMKKTFWHEEQVTKFMLTFAP